MVLDPSRFHDSFNTTGRTKAKGQNFVANDIRPEDLEKEERITGTTKSS